MLQFAHKQFYSASNGMPSDEYGGMTEGTLTEQTNGGLKHTSYWYKIRKHDDIITRWVKHPFIVPSRCVPASRSL